MTAPLWSPVTDVDMTVPSDLECVILAGGLATRMRPHTVAVPKVLLPVAGQPFADHQLRRLAEQGVRRVVYAIGFLGEQVRAFVGDGSRWGLDVAYVDEGADLRGTGGAARLALDQGQVTGDAFLLTYGDSLLDVEVGAVVRAFDDAGQPALMVVIENDGRLGVSNARYALGAVTRYSKPSGSADHAGLTHVDYGLSVFASDIVRELVPSGHRCDLADVQSQLCREGRMAGFLAERPYREIGSPEGWRALHDELSAPGRS